MRKSMSQNTPPLLTKTFSPVTLEQSADIARATAELALTWLAHPDMRTHGIRVWLRGDLGAGKTTWVREFLIRCGISGRIKSPSFSVVESYEHNGVTFHHIDFYREAEPTTWQSAGLRDVIGDRAVTLIEWPEHAAGLPPPHIDVAIDWALPAEAGGPRRITVTFFNRHDGPGLERLLDAWQHGCP